MKIEPKSYKDFRFNFFKEFIMKENKETKKSSEKESSKGGCGCGK